MNDDEKAFTLLRDSVTCGDAELQSAHDQVFERIHELDDEAWPYVMRMVGGMANAAVKCAVQAPGKSAAGRIEVIEEIQHVFNEHVNAELDALDSIA